MHKDIWTDRQIMLGAVPFEFYHYLDSAPPQVAPHQHPFYEIFFFLGGNVTYTIEGKTYPLRPGDILLTNTQDIHRPNIFPGKPYERIVLWLSADFFQAIPGDAGALSTCFSDAATKDYRLIRPGESDLIRLRNICNRISGAQKSEKLGSDTLTYAYVLEFLIQICRCYYASGDAAHISDITQDEKINGVIGYINEHISESLSLDQLAEAFFTSKFYLSRKFREYTGLSIYQYIIKRRLSIARDALIQGDTVTDAFLRCGFGDYSNFLKAFKREFGKTPKEFAKNNLL